MSKRASQRRTLFLRDADRRIVARAETRWTFVNLENGRPLAIPEHVLGAFDLVESEDDVLREVGWATVVAGG